MIRRAIALVARETIAGKLAFIVEHHPVARHLGNYRRCRDTKALTIATDDLCLWQFKSGNQPPVDEHMVGSPDERQKRSLARQHRGPINIKFVNLARARETNSDCEGALIDQRKEFLPFLRRELLGIVNALDEDLGRKDDGGSDDRSRHGTDAPTRKGGRRTSRKIRPQRWRRRLRELRLRNLQIQARRLRRAWRKISATRSGSGIS